MSMNGDRIDSHKQIINMVDLSEDDRALMMKRLYELLRYQVRKYNGIDSTSMPMEKVQDIMQSLLYTVDVAVIHGVTKDALLHGNLAKIMEDGQRILLEKKKSLKVEWKLLCQSAPRIQNAFFLSTLQSLGSFFEQYDVYFGAHQIPCDIDYWPLVPVSEDLKGISYMETYLRYLQIENDFLTFFPISTLILLYEKYIPDYKELLFNLCEPVLTNAIGLVLIGEEIQLLNFSVEYRNRIYQLIKDKPLEDIRVLIEDAVLELCRKTGIKDLDDVDYLIKASDVLSPRLYEAIQHGDLSEVFISIR